MLCSEPRGVIPDPPASQSARWAHLLPQSPVTARGWADSSSPAHLMDQAWGPGLAEKHRERGLCPPAHSALPDYSFCPGSRLSQALSLSDGGVVSRRSHRQPALLPQVWASQASNLTRCLVVRPPLVTVLGWREGGSVQADRPSGWVDGPTGPWGAPCAVCLAVGPGAVGRVLGH